MARGAWRPRSLRWRIAQPHPAAEGLARQLRTAPLVGQVLANRGVTAPDAAKAFLNPKLTDLHDPELLAGAIPAAERIAAAVSAGQRIILYGDYDVDGITGVAILHACLKMAGARSEFYVPHRLDEGYGVNAEAVAKLAAGGPGLLITIDCGISAIEPLAAALAAGLDVIVTDHHAPGDQLPDATAIVHPALGGTYPNANLCGAGVALKLAWQTARRLCGRNRVDEPMRDFLLDATCLAALGTIADVVPLVGENRSLAVFGLRGLVGTRHPGMRALLDSAGLTGGKVGEFDVGFTLAPRLNAAGRMGHARLAVELLTDAPPRRCAEIAAYLVQQNAERQKVERQIADEAAKRVADAGLDKPASRVIVLASESWHGGVIGIVASRLVEQFGRPAVLIAFGGGDVGHGSGRSVSGLHMRDALAACAEHLESFGGHAMAGGVRIRRDRVDIFAAAMQRYAAENLKADELVPTLAIDAEASMVGLGYPVVEHLSRMAPFGQGNPRPCVALRGCRVVSPPKRMGRNGGTASMVVSQSGATMRAVGFGMGDLADLLVGIHQVDLAASPAINEFNGRTSIELQLQDVTWD
jgi:single-stranded-DNA-specific exonuclease